ncbi:MAG: anti-phage dCTP deaminase [Oceanibaculum sp.]
MLAVLNSPELVFGICSPVGTDNTKVTNMIKSRLHAFGYMPHAYKVTDMMKQIKIKGETLVDSPLIKRYDSHINYANKMRELYEDDGVLATLCPLVIRQERKAKGVAEDSYVKKTAYIFDQFKRPEEIKDLRQIYGRLFILVSIYSDKDKRAKRLAERIAMDDGYGRPNSEHFSMARGLIAKDEEEEEVSSGQRMRETFSLGDVFINIDNEYEAENILRRFFMALFGSNKISPSRDEYGMYMAKSASLRSADLSRQVGAAVFHKSGEILALGANEVPKAGGGTYWEGDKGDFRDFVLGRDENDRIKRSLVADIIKRLIKGGHLNGVKVDEISPFIEKNISDGSGYIKSSLIMDIIEFGRIIHAEMSAISDAARLGISIKGATLYCTTFPCHICAKHIVSTGIDRVLFIEPYPKSYAEQLHEDSISIGGGAMSDKVVFSPFIGISPYRYRELFERGKRKNKDGILKEWINGSPMPNIPYVIATFLANEQAAGRKFSEKTAKLESDGKIKIS